MTPKTSYETPPGPNADHWRAWCDRLGADCSPYGQGMTEVEAIADLERQIAESEWRAGAAHERRIWRMAIERYFDGTAVEDVEGYVEEFRKFVDAEDDT